MIWVTDFPFLLGVDPRVEGELDPDNVPDDAIFVFISPGGEGDEEDESATWAADVDVVNSGDGVLLLDVSMYNWPCGIS